MIYVTGDLHGDLQRFKEKAIRRLGRGDFLLCCGDFGFVWDGSAAEEKVLSWIGKRRFTTLFVDGCHDNLDLLARYRKMLEAQHVKIFADIYCKHGAPLVERDLDTVAKEMISRGMADALVVDGAESAKPAPVEKIQAVRAAVPETPIFLGSGMTVDTTDYLRHADGCVFGFGTKPSGDMNDLVDGPTVKRFMEQVKQL